MVLLQCVTWSFHTEDPADGRLLHAAPPLDLKPHHSKGLSSPGRPESLAAINDVIVQIRVGFVPTGLEWPSTWTHRRQRLDVVDPGDERAGVVTAGGYGTTAV